MSNKLTTEELNKVNSLGERYSRLFSSIGQIAVKIMEYQKEQALLHEEYSKVLSEELELTSLLESKYGQGIINITTGEITAIS